MIVRQAGCFSGWIWSQMLQYNVFHNDMIIATLHTFKVKFEVDISDEVTRPSNDNSIYL